MPVTFRLHFHTWWHFDHITMALQMNNSHIIYYSEATLLVALVWTYFTNADYLVIQSLINHLLLFSGTINQAGSCVYCYIKFFLEFLCSTGWGVLWVHSFHLLLCSICVCVPATYEWNMWSCLIGVISMRMSSKCPASFLIHSWRSCSIVIGVLCIGLVLHTISLPVFITLMLQHNPGDQCCLPLPLWLVVNGQTSSLWTPNVNPLGRENEPLWVSLPLMYLFWHVFRAS